MTKDIVNAKNSTLKRISKHEKSVEDKVNKLIAKLSATEADIDEKKKILSTLSEDAKASADYIEELRQKSINYSKEIASCIEENEATHSTLNGQVTDISEAIETVEDDLEMFRSNCSDINKLYNDTFGYIEVRWIEITEEDASKLPEEAYRHKNGKYQRSTNKEVLGTKDKINNLLDEIAKDKSSHKIAFDNALSDMSIVFEGKCNKFRNEQHELKNVIESLLPGATVAGLASAYEIAKNKQNIQKYLWQMIFIMSMFMMVGAVVILYNIGAYSLSSEMSLRSIIIQILKILPIELPFIWVGIVANRKINQHTRLHEEYLHKWSVARSFEGLREKAEGISNKSPDLLQILFKNFININAENPSLTLDETKEDVNIANTAAGLVSKVLPKTKTEES